MGFYFAIIKRPGKYGTIFASTFLLLQKYYLWPKPYSDLACEILELLTIEQKAPGDALRTLFFNEHPEIIGKPTNTSYGQFLFTHLHWLTHFPLLVRKRLIHLYFDYDLTEAALIDLINSFKSIEDAPIPDMQMSLLASNFLLHFSLFSSPSFPFPHGASDFCDVFAYFSHLFDVSVWQMEH